MDASRLRLLVLVAGLMLVGLAVGLWFRASGEVAARPTGDLWFERRIDLMIQLGLIYVGALGIRALLPSKDEA